MNQEFAVECETHSRFLGEIFFEFRGQDRELNLQALGKVCPDVLSTDFHRTSQMEAWRGRNRKL
ncbi:MAG: hypothetical protein JWM04_2613 [Verrucomicrobiales bacterium]|jgi:hypothetical protein|nr:hypothetical protein [Verrucomicrobiales bacterium]